MVGYTSGDNETLSLPFLLSRGSYADVVGRRALAQEVDQAGVPDTRLLWIDYGTHLEVLVANLLLGANEQRIAPGQLGPIWRRGRPNARLAD